MAALGQLTPPRPELQLLVRRNFSSQARDSFSQRHSHTTMLVNFRFCSAFLCVAPRPLGCRGKQESCVMFSIRSASTLLSTDLRLAAREQRIFGGGGCSGAEKCSTGGTSSQPISRIVPHAGFRDKFKKGVRKAARKRNALEERLQTGFKIVGLGRQFGQLPQWSAYVPLIAGGLEALVIVGWTIYLKGDLRGSSMFNLSGEGLLTFLLGSNFAVGWIASQMSTWRVQDLSPSLIGRGKSAAKPGAADFLRSFFVNVIPYGNFLAWIRFAWKESNSVSSLNALVYVVPSLVRLVLWSQGLTIGRAEFLAWVLGAIHRPYDAARVKNEELLAVANAKIRAARKAKEEKERLEEGPELTVDEMILLQQRKELEEFDILLARTANGAAPIPGPTKDWSVRDTISWLAREGFVRYATAFAENDIDGAILLLLSDDDLRNELGIQSLGDRKKLRQAIQRLK